MRGLVTIRIVAAALLLTGLLNLIAAAWSSMSSADIWARRRWMDEVHRLPQATPEASAMFHASADGVKAIGEAWKRSDQRDAWFSAVTGGVLLVGGIALLNAGRKQRQAAMPQRADGVR